MSEPLTSKDLVVGGFYNWKGQPERLSYIGAQRYNGDSRTWHQFALVDVPGVCWCEVLDWQLNLFEVTERAAVQAAQPEAVGEAICERCNGSGETAVLSGGGPDAYDVAINCPACKGSGFSCAMTDAAGEAFNNTFHKVRAEVSMDWWQRIWAKAVEWERSRASAPTPEPMSAPTEAKPATQQAIGEREAGKWPITVEDLHKLATIAMTNGKTEAFFQVTLQWADKANAEIARLRAALAAQPGAVGEPVAWALYFTNEHGTPMREPFFSKAHMERHKLHNETMRGLECRVEPLYAAAPTEAKPAQDAVDAVIVDAYAFPTADLYADEIKIQRTRQIEGPALWKVMDKGNCLNKSGEWEWEPMPSSRDDEFLARCRFDTADEAIRAAISAKKGGQP